MKSDINFIKLIHISWNFTLNKGFIIIIIIIIIIITTLKILCNK